FDDVSMKMEDVQFVRLAASKALDGLTSEDRAAIYTLSGAITQDFTNDREALRKTLSRLVPSQIGTSAGQGCPEISYYQADQITNHHDIDALTAAIQETITCLNLNIEDPAQYNEAVQIATTKTRQVLAQGDSVVHFQLANFNAALNRLSSVPGQRT